MAGGEAESGERDASCHGAEGEDVEPSAGDGFLFGDISGTKQ